MGRGHSFKKPGTARDQRIIFLATEAEKASLVKEAGKRGVSVGELIRERVFNGANEKGKK